MIYYFHFIYWIIGGGAFVHKLKTSHAGIKQFGNLIKCVGLIPRRYLAANGQFINFSKRDPGLPFPGIYGTKLQLGEL